MTGMAATPHLELVDHLMTADLEVVRHLDHLEVLGRHLGGAYHHMAGIRPPRGERTSAGSRGNHERPPLSPDVRVPAESNDTVRLLDDDADD